MKLDRQNFTANIESAIVTASLRHPSEINILMCFSLPIISKTGLFRQIRFLSPHSAPFPDRRFPV